MKFLDLVSIIVPVYNNDAYLPECIDSILCQTYGNMELLLIDDGSTDTSPRICDEYAARDPRIRVIHKENGGVSLARNAGLDAATGDWVTFVDSDDHIDPNYVAFLLGSAKESGSDLSYCSFTDYTNVVPQPFSQTFDKLKVEAFDSLYVLQNAFSLWLIPNVWAKLARRELFRDIRFPVGVVRAEDLDVTYRLVHAATRVANIRHCPLYHYRTRPGSAMGRTTVSSLVDFDMRLKAYALFQTLEGCEKTRESFSRQTLRFYLDFALQRPAQVQDYKLFRRKLQKYGRILAKKNVEISCPHSGRKA